MATLINQKIVIVKKRHKCHGCEKIIDEKQKAQKETWVHEDGIGTLYYCENCYPVLKDDKFWDWCNGEVLQGNIREYLEDVSKENICHR